MRLMKKVLLASALSLGLSGMAMAAPGQVDYANSKIIATSKQMGVPTDGQFKKFTAAVDFDPAKPAAASVSMHIDVASFDLGDPAYNKQTLGKEWFDAAGFPAATFVSSAINPANATSLTVTGTLTIKGKPQTVTIPVSVATKGPTTTFDGTFPIKRNYFGIGTGEWKDTSVVADEVLIKFHIVENK